MNLKHRNVWQVDTTFEILVLTRAVVVVGWKETRKVCGGLEVQRLMGCGWFIVVMGS